MTINRINNNDMILTVGYRLLWCEIESINYIDCFIKSCDAENDEQLIDIVYNWLNTEIHVPYEIITVEYINFVTGQKYRIV